MDQPHQLPTVNSNALELVNVRFEMERKVFICMACRPLKTPPHYIQQVYLSVSHPEEVSKMNLVLSSTSEFAKPKMQNITTDFYFERENSALYFRILHSMD